MSIAIYYTILFLEILNGFWCFYRSFKYLCKQNKETKNMLQQNEGKSNILIVIPCLREQDIIIQTLNYFLELIKQFNNVKILIVTTQKEEFEKKLT